jgi:hypothetical protein
VRRLGALVASTGFGQNAILYQADHMVFGFLIKLLWNVLDFPIYADGTKSGTLHWRPINRLKTSAELEAPPKLHTLFFT